MKKTDEKKILYDYYIENSTKLISAVKNNIENPGTKNIHNLRVLIKRIRAIYKLLERLSGNVFREKEHSLHVKRIFKETGKLRDLHIKSGMLNRHVSNDKLKSFYDYLHANKETIHKDIAASLREFDFEKYTATELSVKELITDLPFSEIETECIKFILSSARKIKRRIESEKNTEQIHTIRKLLKELHAASELLYLINKSRALKILLKLVKKTEEDLGKWHDNIILLISINDYKILLKKNNKIPDKDLLELEAELKLRNEEMLGYLIPEVDNLMKSIK